MSVLKNNINLTPEYLRKLIKDQHVVVPGVFNGISALLAEQAGFKALYLSGSGIAGSMGLPDLSLTTLNEVVEEARKIVAVTALPLIVDVDTGFGETLNIIRTVRMMESAGVSAIHIEDQALPKKCGHLTGKKLVTEEEMARKISIATETKKNSDFIIIARTDARAVEGFDATVRRGKIYLEAGADMIFPEALETVEEFREYAKQVNAPLFANMTEFGKSPLMSASELGELGYKIVIFPLTAFRAALLTLENVYKSLYAKRSQREFMDQIMTRERFYEVIGYKEYELEDQLLFKREFGKVSKPLDSKR